VCQALDQGRVRSDVGDRLEAVRTVVAVEDRHPGVRHQSLDVLLEQEVCLALVLGELKRLSELHLVLRGLYGAPYEAEEEEAQR